MIHTHNVNDDPKTCPQLLTGERIKLAFFIEQHPDARAEILAQAHRDPTISGPLRIAYEWALTA